LFVLVDVTKRLTTPGPTFDIKIFPLFIDTENECLIAEFGGSEAR
jgi:hypothetical protein